MRTSADIFFCRMPPRPHHTNPTTPPLGHPPDCSAPRATAPPPDLPATCLLATFLPSYLPIILCFTFLPVLSVLPSNFFPSYLLVTFAPTHCPTFVPSKRHTQPSVCYLSSCLPIDLPTFPPPVLRACSPSHLRPSVTSCPPTHCRGHHQYHHIGFRCLETRHGL